MMLIRSAKVVAAALMLAAAPALVSAKHTTVKLAADATSVVKPVGHHHTNKLSTHKKHTSAHTKTAKHHSLSHKKASSTKLSHKTSHTSARLSHQKTAHSAQSSKSTLFGK